MTGVCLEEVSEFDEMFVLDYYGGKPIDAGMRRHGAKAGKKGISSETGCAVTMPFQESQTAMTKK